MPTRPPGTPDVDLTFDGASGTINGAVFMTGTFQATPGQLSSFLEIRNNGTEQGYNTDGALQQDQRDVQNSTHSILLAEVPIVIGDGSNGTVEGVAYREFRLNLGEAGNAKQYLSLDALQLWQEESGSLTNFTPASTPGSGGFAGAHTNYLAYNLDAGGDHWIGLKEGANGNGADQTEFTILIPDADFINDPSHRYITLYSKFGMQAGWEADSSSEEWGLSHASGGPVSAMTAHKTVTLVNGVAPPPLPPDGSGPSVDSAGDVISYEITIANVGNTNLTGITVVDTVVSNLVLVSGDNGNGILDTGETWHYTASYTVTQNDLNTNGGGDGAIDNTVTADSAQTTPVSATAIVEVVSGVSVDLVKTADVSSVDAAGDVINYTITVENDGTVTLTNPAVNDTQINIVTPVLDFGAPIPNTAAQIFVALFDGDSNLGDNNNNGIVDLTDGNGQRDPGETWQYAYIGDTNLNGFHDPGETWTAYNLRDTNQNGVRDGLETQFVGDTNNNSVQEAGERWQFKNLWDLNNNGRQDSGEVWHYQNVGDLDGSGTQGPGETFSYYNAGDTNQNGFEDPGETFQYYNAGDTDHDGNVDDGETFQFNVSHAATYVSGDDGNGELDVGETWTYSVSYTVTQADIDNGGIYVTDPDNPLTHDNTASVTTPQSASDEDTESVLIVQNPHLIVSKTASIPDTNTAGDPTLNDGKIDSPADDITYTISVLNDGNMTLTSVNLNDSLVGTLTSHTDSGAGTHGDGNLDVGETWTYTAVYNTQQSDIDNRGNADGTADNKIHNTATVTTAQSAGGAASADVLIDYRPHLSVAKAASIPDSDHDGKIDSPADNITYTVTVVNDGNVTLTGVSTSDSIVGPLTSHTDSGAGTHGDGNLDVGETWTYTAVYDTQQSDIDNHGNVDGTPDNNIHNTATVTTTQSAGGSDSVDVPIDYHPSFTLSMTALGYHDANSNNVADAGDTIDFSLVETNTGNVTLHNITVSDLDGVVIFAGSVASLGVGATDTTSITGTHLISAGDVGVGYIEDEAVGQALEAPPSPVSGTVHVDLAGLLLL